MSSYRLAAFADEAGSALSQQIAAMERNGIDGLEIRGVNGKNVTELTLQEAGDIRNELDAHGLKVWSIGSPIGKIGIRDDFVSHMDLYKHTLEIAVVLGAEAVRLFSFFIPKGDDPEIYRDEVLYRLYRFAEEGRSSGLMLCHENEKGIYGDVASRCETILKNVDNIYAVFDPANFIQCGQDTMEAWKMIRSYVKYMHIKDCLPDGFVVPAGKGIGHIDEILPLYFAQGGSVLTLEPHLTVFDGLKGLERDGERSQVSAYSYPSPDIAFDTAVHSLKELL